MKFTYTFFVFLLILTSCHVEVEVPAKKCAVVVRGGEIETSVLPEGRHRVAYSSKLVLFDVTQQELNLSFDFLLKDATSGQVDCTIMFVAVPEGLPEFFRKYETTHLEAAVLVEVKDVVRKMFADYTREMVMQDDLKTTVLKALQRNRAIRSYAKIKDIGAFDIKL